MGVELTDRQALAAAAQDLHVNVVSAPGSGKTTVAAERFGYLRHENADGWRGILGLSFNRAAVGVLRKRIAARWGSQALGFPNLVSTFDDFHVRTLHHLLRLGLVKWPGGFLELDVLDDYSSRSGCRWIEVNGWIRFAACELDGAVVSKSMRSSKPKQGFGRAADHREALGGGVASHDDVRSVLLAALKIPDIQDAVDGWLLANYRHVVVDEIYDADELDLHLTSRAAGSGIGVTVVGDPWQALYGWRGATPEKVQSNLLGRHDFRGFDQPESFRFETSSMRTLARQLRGGESVALAPISNAAVDVALARRWKQLWEVGDNVLPLAFRSQIGNGIDAVLCLLLDVAAGPGLGLPAHGRHNAMSRLDLPEEDLEAFRADVLRPALVELVAGVPASAVIENLRVRTKDSGRKRPQKTRDEKGREDELDLLRARLQRSDLIPGLTVHQAKGREWNRVGVVLTGVQKRLLDEGLRELEPEHCVLYVALTRARQICGALQADPAQHLRTAVEVS